MKVLLGQRNSTTQIHWTDISEVPANEECVIHFPGANAQTSEAANGSVKILETTLPYHFDNYYSVYYDTDTFEGTTPYTAFRQTLFEGKDGITPEIKTCFQAIFAPRFATTPDGHLDIDQTTQNLEKMFFVAHCHGTSVFNAVLKYMKKQLGADPRDGGYGLDEDQQKTIMGAINAHAIAPACPLEWSGANVLAFVSLSDENTATIGAKDFEFKEMSTHPEVQFLTWLRAQLNGLTGKRSYEEALANCAFYIPAHQMVVVGRKFKQENPNAQIDEHNNISYNSQWDVHNRTPLGLEVVYILKNTIECRFSFYPRPMEENRMLAPWKERGEKVWRHWENDGASTIRLVDKQPKSRPPLSRQKVC